MNSPKQSTISLLIFILGGEIFGSLPIMYPKSMWKSFPSFVSIKLSKCLSPTPSKYVMTEYPAHDSTKFCIDCMVHPPGPFGSGLWIAMYARRLSCSFKMSAIAEDFTNSIKPISVEVAKTRYVVSRKSKFSRFHNLSMSWINCTHSWSCLQSSPLLNMTFWVSSLMSRNASFNGLKALLNTKLSSELIPVKLIKGSNKCGMLCVKYVNSVPMPCPFRIARSLSTFLAPLKFKMSTVIEVKRSINTPCRFSAIHCCVPFGPRSWQACSNIWWVAMARRSKLGFSKPTTRNQYKKLAKTSFLSAREMRNLDKTESSEGSYRNAWTSWSK